MIIPETTVQIIDNCLPPSLFKKVQNYLLDFSEVPFYFLETTAYEPIGPLKATGHSFHHIVVGDGGFRSPYAELLHDAILVACDKAGRPIDKLIRVRLGLITGTEKTRTNMKHIDQDTPHTTGLLYLNNTDGDTIIYSGTYEEDKNTSMVEQSNTKMSILQKITPCENRVIFFNGYSFHSSSTPTKTPYRLVVNFNFTEKDDRSVS
jgi:hypothetical protein